MYSHVRPAPRDGPITGLGSVTRFDNSSPYRYAGADRPTRTYTPNTHQHQCLAVFPLLPHSHQSSCRLPVHFVTFSGDIGDTDVSALGLHTNMSDEQRDGGPPSRQPCNCTAAVSVLQSLSTPTPRAGVVCVMHSRCWPAVVKVILAFV